MTVTAITRLFSLQAILPALIMLCGLASVIAARPDVAINLINNMTNNAHAVDEDITVLDAMVKTISAKFPEQANVGDLVEIDASATEAKMYRWVMIPETANMRVVDGGSKLVFSSPVARSYTVVLAVNFGADIDLRVMNITIGNCKDDVCKPEAKPDMAPGPKVEPKPEPKKVGMAKTIDRLLAQVDTANKQEDARRLAENFETVAKLIKQKALTTPEAIIAATSSMNRDTLGDSAPDWEPLTEGLNTLLNKMSSDKKLESLEDHAIVWLEIANALKA